ncbi:FUSC family protein [Tamlana flava]|uniref:FUSC family protein n=1 Tax=Tamlana flava TaxID=3158572 RepID=UPI00351B667C
MKRLFTILAIIASVFAIILAVLPVSNFAVFPSIAALIFGLIAFYLSKKSGQVKKIIQFSFLLTIMALGITIYKAIFTEAKVADTEALEATEIKLEEEALDELEGIEIEEVEIDESELEDMSIQ